MEVIMTFEWDGKTVHKDVKGAQGGSCIAKTKFLEDALGDPGQRHLKAEFYNEQQNQQSQQNQVRL